VVCSGPLGARYVFRVDLERLLLGGEGSDRRLSQDVFGCLRDALLRLRLLHRQRGLHVRCGVEADLSFRRSPR